MLTVCMSNETRKFSPQFQDSGHPLNVGTVVLNKKRRTDYDEK